MLGSFSWFCIACAVAALLTWVVRQHVIARGILDVPNARSSHTQPTARGGGLAIVLVVTGGTLILLYAGSLAFKYTLVLVVGGILIALAGYVDDRSGLSAQHRILVHIVAALLVILTLGGWGESAALFSGIPATVSFAVLLLGIVWSINLFNFMDGIDGIAGSQAAFVSGVSAALVLLEEGSAGWSALLAITAGASTGFLIWNWPPAKIFMGDVGSGFLGFWLASIAVLLHVDGAQSIWTSIVLGSLFIADATATLVRRMVSGQKWYEAHRSHLYQQLASRAGNHRVVTLGFLAFNLLIVLPIAFFVQRHDQLGPWIAGSMLTALALICWLAGAGRSAKCVEG